MYRMTYHTGAGEPVAVKAEAGTNLMRAAIDNGVSGIVGECGGQAMCATCHVYVRDEYLGNLPEMSEEEEEMLDCTAALHDEKRSRLGCQIEIGPELDGIEVDVPGSQV